MKSGNTPVGLEHALRALVVEVVREELAKVSPPAPDGYLTVREAGVVAGVVPSTVRKWLAAGRLPRYSAGADPRVKRSDLERLLRTPHRKRVDDELSPEEMALRDFG